MITRVEAKRYKCLQDVQQDLGRLHILAGPNASGKTTFLDAIVFLRDLLEKGVFQAVKERAQSVWELLYKGEGNSFVIAVEMSPPESLFGEKRPKYRWCRYEIRVGIHPSEGGVRLLSENFWLLKKPSQGIRQPEQQPPSDWREVVTSKEDGSAYIRSETTGWILCVRSPSDRPALTMIPDEANRFPIAMWARTFLTHKVREFALNGSRLKEPSHPGGPDFLLPDGSNLPRIIWEFQKHHPQQFQLWLRYVQTILPDIQSIEVRERMGDRHLYLVVRFGETQVPGSLLSDGILRILALTLLAYLPPGDTVYLIEGLENGLPDHAIERVFQSFSAVYRGQVLMTSYSGLLQRLAGPEQILHFIRDRHQSVSIVRGEKDNSRL